MAINKDAIMTLELKANDYTWEKPLADGVECALDGGTMINILMDEVDPSIIVGTDNFWQKIQAARLSKFG